MRRLTPIVLFTFVVASPVLADETFSLKVGYATLDPDGKFAGENGGIATEIDFDDDLGFDSSDGVIAEGAVQLGPFRLSAGYLPLDFSGDGRLTQDITFGGETFTVGTDVKSDVEIDVYDFGFAFHLLNLDDGSTRVQLGPELAVKLADIDMSIRESAGGTSERVGATVPVPTIGARGRVGFADYFGVVGRVGYLEVSGNSFLDADVQVEFSPVPLVGVFAGYRYVNIDVDESGVLFDSTLAGPYVGAMVRF
ncbi:MAG: hypothetical protein GWN84_12265 [Gammaproteobacteria bacterium]|nr:hypothetical protein [Gammaproteobacteria bacterium]NIR83696.1 hypothetical protein [Gammaproteobacteria bacterium]NIR91671.1 hypothetical protein [Gammaproteobacteria bacterium]NIU04858.1 hypothetical protein [Gammaproteobacteria bacterium]NIV51844.1 hypothetical protein [Gammaproteobacteria bacterium]